MKKLYTILTAFFMIATFALQAQSILLVNDNNSHPERVEPLKTALTNLGYSYSYFSTIEKSASPTIELMNSFDLVILYLVYL